MIIPNFPTSSQVNLQEYLTYVASLASEVQGYLTMAEKRTETARTDSTDSLEVDDLENIANPEMIMPFSV